jgi:hypothetical protein
LPESIIEKDFKKFEGKKMTAEEFSITLRKHRHNTKFGKKLAEKSDSGLVLDGRNVKATDQDFRKTNA